MSPCQQNSVLMNFQKQANYRARKKNAEVQNDIEKKAARMCRDRVCYLKKKTVALEAKMNKVKNEQVELVGNLKTLGKNQMAVVMKQKALVVKQKQIALKIKEMKREQSQLETD